MNVLNLLTGATERQYFLNSRKKAIQDVLKFTNFLVNKIIKLYSNIPPVSEHVIASFSSSGSDQKEAKKV
jgi:hypothetical protein